MDRRTIVGLVLVLALVAIIGTVLLTAYADNYGFDRWLKQRFNWGAPAFPRLGGWPYGRGQYGFIEVSREYNETAINIAKSDPDVQNLLNNGYSIVGVRPIFTTKVEGKGSVTIKATSAIVMLQKDRTSWASAYVDLEAGKVTRLEISTRTVIEKSP